MQFKYEAVTKTGESQIGTVEAVTKEKALETLHRHNLIVTVIDPLKQSGFAIKNPFSKRADIKDLVIFSRQLATLVEAKITLIQALRTLIKQTNKESFKEAIFAIAVAVEGGTSFSDALGLYPDIFSDFYINIIKSGEASGNLDETLIYLADHLEKQYDLESKVKGAMTYPAVILIVFLIIGVIMMTFVLPKILGVITASGSQEDLPIVTKILIFTSAFMTTYWWALLGGLIVFGAGITAYAKTKEGKKNLDILKLKLPVLGPLYQKIYLARFAENLATLVKGGLPIVKSLQISGDVIGNEVFKAIIVETIGAVKSGEQIATVLMTYPEIPPLVSNMINVGERTGRLEYVLKNISKFYNREVDNSVASLSTIIEPVMIVCLGVAVAILVAGILLPIYNMAGNM